MLTKCTFLFFFLLSGFLYAQTPDSSPTKIFDIPQGRGKEPFIARGKSKVYNRFKNAVKIYVRYENGDWEQRTIEPGYEIIELDICGKTDDENCLVTLRIYTTPGAYRDININGGCRYIIQYDAQMKFFWFKEVC